MYKLTSVEDQQKIIVPLNRDTEHLFYNQRFIIDNKILTEPRTWKLSKVNRLDYLGNILITCVQDKFNAGTDYIEKDENGDVIGMWADYFTSGVIPENPDDAIILPTIRSTITYSGVKPEIKIGGSYKKLTVTFYDNDVEITYRPGIWSFTIDEMDASDLVTVLDQSTSTELDVNQIKVKFVKDDSYIGKVLKISHISGTIISEIEMALVAL